MNTGPETPDPMSPGDPLGLFDPVIAGWFRDRFAGPTHIQNIAWPRISAGEHVLLSAPTGSGKTLTAFLWAINQLATGYWSPGHTSVLYISPLKALNNDIRTNLTEPLAEISARFLSAGREIPPISALTRSGDTPQSERQRMLKHPPEILITTPESLNLILSSSRARETLRTVRTVILDEIHAVIDSKRGTHLCTAVERMTLLAGEFQRIGISATVRPMDLVAEFIGGFRRTGDGYEPRRVVSLAAPREKKLSLSVRFPVRTEKGLETPESPTEPEELWPSLVEELHAIIDRNRSTLVFVTTRRHAEKITELLNEGTDEPVAYAHHGSLSREIRSYVEQSLKAGRLRAIVATNSLELGIDIGLLDEVVMVRTPMTVSSTLQRLGRAGHQVDATSRGVLFPLHGRDVVDAAVMARATLEQDIESAAPVLAPLDVLAQQLVSMTAVEVWDINELYSEVRTSWPYRSLERSTFDLVVEMLAGRYAQTRIRELRPRVIVDRVDNTIKARDGVLPVLYQSGGTIPDRGNFGLRLADGGSKVGELDEEFVWERKTGDTFYLGSQLWTITAINDRDVEVVPGNPGEHIIPFWRAEARGRGRHYSELTCEFLEACEYALQNDRLGDLLAGRPELDSTARLIITQTLETQRADTGTDLPHRHHLVVEHYLRSPDRDRRRTRGHRRPRSFAAHRAGSDAAGERDGGDNAAAGAQEIIVHCPWGMEVNQPFSLALAAVWEEAHGYPLEVFADDSCLMLLLPADFTTAEAFGPAVCRGLLRPGRLEQLLRLRLEQSGMFGALFRENAGRALLLPKGGFNRRMPLWLNRIRSKKLLTAVQSFEDFPILLETWRTCLQDRFDLSALRVLLAEIASGAVSISECETTVPSLFAADVVWRQTDLYMYLDDSLPGGSGSRLSGDLLREAARNAALRPHIPVEIAAQLEERLQRLAPGYAPTNGDEIVEWLKERIALPAGEAIRLKEAIARDLEQSAGGPASGGGEPTSFPRLPENRLCWIDTGMTEPLLVAVEQLPSMVLIVPELSLKHVHDASPETWWEPSTDPGLSSELAQLANRFLAAESNPADPDLRTQTDPASVLAQWIRFYGPRSIAWPAQTLGIEPGMAEDLTRDLSEQDIVVIGSLIEGGEEAEFCDAENLEHLLALLRRSHRPVFQPVPPERLVGLWARTTGLLGSITRTQSGAKSTAGHADPDSLVSALESLFGYPAPVQLWESEIIPGRLSEYYPVWLDGLLKESGLCWFGCGTERLGFALDDDLPLFLPLAPGTESAPGESLETVELLRERQATDFWELSDALGISSEDLTTILWTATWNGMIANDSFETVRKGTLTHFTATPAAVPGAASSSWPGRRRPTRSRRGWAATRPLSGRWFALGPAPAGSTPDDRPDSAAGMSPGEPQLLGTLEPPSDPITTLEMEKERARIVLGRYGVLFRELLERELPSLRWRRIFTALRMMELSGEVVAGGFVEGVSGVQFAYPAALAVLAEDADAGDVIWMNATDPASPCGLSVGKMYPDLPTRVPSNHVVFRSNSLVMVSRKNGGDLTFLVSPADPDLPRMLSPLRNMVGRRWNPKSRVTVQMINETEARESPYAGALIKAGFRPDRRRLVLSAGYR
jgi:ATP-dependent helicase Lhr and Lhr-like helicase